MLKFVILVIAIVSISAEMKSYDNFKVFRIFPKTQEHLEILRTLEYQSDEFSFWKEPGHPNTTVDLMVAPGKSDDFTKLVNDLNIKYEVYIDNVQTLIDHEKSSIVDRDSTYLEATFNWTTYHDLDKIYAWLDTLVKDYPNNVEGIVAGTSYEGRDIKGIKVSFGKGNPGIFIEGGIHAREWITPATVTYIVNEILTNQDPKVRSTVESYDWYIVPVFNPDGYEYTHTQDRLWRKTRTYYRECRGADANRNWDFQWMNGGSSDNQCSAIFAGSSAFSEIETRSLSRYISSIADKFIIYIAFHSYGQHLVFPYGYTAEHLDNYDEVYNISAKAIDAISQRYGTKYDIGNTVEVIYIASGSSMDWVKANFKTPVVYTFELRDKGQYGFILPPKMIIPVGEEIVDGLKVILEETKKLGYPRN